MATVLTEDFNARNNGNLTGQGSWSGSTAFQVQEATKKEGAKAVQIDLTNGQNLSISNVAALTPDGAGVMYVRASNSNYNYLLALWRNVDDSAYAISWKWTGADIGYYAPAYTVLKANAVANVWYALKVEWRNSDMKVRYQVDDEGWTEWTGRETNNDPGSVKLTSYANGGSISAFFDYIAETAIAPPAVGHSRGLIF